MSDEDEWSDEEDVDTPIDSIDPFVVFAETIRQLQGSGAPRFQVWVCMLALAVTAASLFTSAEECLCTPSSYEVCSTEPTHTCCWHSSRQLAAVS